MKKHKLLFIGRDALILEMLLNHFNAQETYEAIGALEDEIAIEIFHNYKFDLVILGAGIDDTSQKKFLKLFTYQNPHISIMQHAGGTNDMLEANIQAVLNKDTEDNFTMFDNPFQN